MPRCPRRLNRSAIAHGLFAPGSEDDHIIRVDAGLRVSVASMPRTNEVAAMASRTTSVAPISDDEEADPASAEVAERVFEWQLSESHGYTAPAARRDLARDA